MNVLNLLQKGNNTQGLVGLFIFADAFAAVSFCWGVRTIIFLPISVRDFAHLSMPWVLSAAYRSREWQSRRGRVEQSTLPCAIWNFKHNGSRACPRSGIIQEHRHTRVVRDSAGKSHAGKKQNCHVSHRRVLEVSLPYTGKGRMPPIVSTRLELNTYHISSLNAIHLYTRQDLEKGL